jgi:hypothetical protein
MNKKITKKPIKKIIKKVARPSHTKTMKHLSPEIVPEKIAKEVLSKYIDEMKDIIASIPEPLKNEERKQSGQPLKYRKDFCIKVIMEMSKGKDKWTIATELGCSFQRFNEWRKLFPEFNYAVKIGEQLSIRWWTEVGRLNIWNKNFNHVLWMMNMTNRTRWISNRNHEIKNIKKVDKKILELNIKDDNDRAGKILSILHSAGALESPAEKSIDTEIN